jgi:hypothetical protein
MKKSPQVVTYLKFERETARYGRYEEVDAQGEAVAAEDRTFGTVYLAKPVFPKGFAQLVKVKVYQA